MKKILITGANGFFASRFYKFYKNKYDILPFTSKELDVRNEASFISKAKEYKPDYIINTAAITSTEICENNPEFTRNININGNVNAAKASEITGAKMIYLSSEQVFNGNPEPGPYTENTLPIPSTNYGRHKLEGEKIVKEMLKDNVWILRFTWMFGLPETCGKTGSNLLWNIISAAIKGEKIKVPANEYRGMTYVYDMISSMDKIFEIPCGTYNVGSRNDLSNYEVAKIVLKSMGISHRINDIIIKDEEKYKTSPRDLRMANDKIASYGITYPETAVAIKKCIEDFNYIF